MTTETLDPAAARHLVVARLGRPPQDMLEAAVVLEAWAGVEAQTALTTAARMMPAAPGVPQPSAGRLPRPARRQGTRGEAAAFVITIVAIAGWAVPLAHSIGSVALADALKTALPITLALQWLLASRYLGRPHGLAHLSAHRVALIVDGALLPALAWAVAGRTGAAAAVLIVIWTGGAILVRGGWPAWYVVVVLAATAALAAGAPAAPVLGLVAVAILGGLWLVLRPPVDPAPGAVGLWPRALVAGAIGAMLGAVLVLDGSVDWSDGAWPASLLLPSAIASVAAAAHLRGLESAMPGAVLGVPASDPRGGGWAWRPLAVLAGALGLLAFGAAALSAGLIVIAPTAGLADPEPGVLAGYALIAMASLLAGLLEALRRGPWALLALACGAAAELAVQHDHGLPSGAGLMVAGALTVVLVLPVAVHLLGRPAPTLATAVWIP